MEDRPALHVIPTELDRQDVYYDFAALAAVCLLTWWMILNGIGWWAVPVVLVVGVWVLTGEGASDVEHVGVIASGLRSKFGQRRAHEWLQAWAHYFRLAIWPVWRANCVAFWRFCRRTTTDWLARLSERIRWSRSLVSSWASATRYRLSAGRVK